MAMTTITSVKLPENKFPHVEVNINDNTIRRYVNVAEEYCRTLCVFRSPKGPDGLKTITGGIEEFVDTYGSGSVAEYGQAFLNASTLAATNAVTLHCLRLTADDAKVSNLHVYMRYAITRFDAENKPEPKQNEVTKEWEFNRTKPETGIMKVYFVAKTDDNLTDVKYLSTNEYTEMQKVMQQVEGHDTEVEVPVKIKYCNPNVKDGIIDEEGTEWHEIWMFSVASLGKGTCGNALSIRLQANDRLNKSTNRMNYVFDIFESGVLKETASISFDESAVNRGKSLYIENVINGEDGSNGSNLINIVNNDGAIQHILSVYQNDVNPKSLIDYTKFDPFFGIDRGVAYGRNYVKIDKTTGKKEDDKNVGLDGVPNMDGYFVITEKKTDGVSSTTPTFPVITGDIASDINIQATFGESLYEGDDGSFASPLAKKADVADAETAKLVKIFSGELVYDEELNKMITKWPYEGIMSTSRYPIDFVLDANYAYAVKIALAEWCNARKQDFILYLDNGTSENMVTKAQAYITTVDMDEVTNKWNIAMDSYYGKIKDPYNQRIVEVTSTYNLARKLPLHWKEHNGKHIPYAGSMYGVIDSYLPNTVFPLMDKDLDADHMNNCIAEHVNYAQINSKGDVIRGTQSSRYPEIGEADILSNLTELNNAHIVLDIKKDCEKLLENFAYNFNESEDLIRFNRRAEVITSKYSAAQVKKISATFDRTADEAEYGILHLYIEVVHKNLVKIAIVDIDVNRNTEE